MRIVSFLLCCVMVSCHHGSDLLGNADGRTDTTHLDTADLPDGTDTTHLDGPTDGPIDSPDAPPLDAPGCGNDVVDPGEQCDDGDDNSDTAADACRSDCTLHRCGDSVIDSGERCDDGNSTHWDGCHDCTVEEFRVNTTTTDNQTRPVVDMTATSGRFVVAWQSRGQDGDGYGVFARVYGPDGPVGGEIDVSQYSAGDQQDPDVAACGDGTFMVVWTSDGQDGSGDAIVARLFEPDGSPEGSEFVVNSFSEGDQRNPAVGATDDCIFVIAWESDEQDGELSGIFAQRYSTVGGPVGDEYPVNSTWRESQTHPDVVVSGFGSSIVVFNSNTHDGDQEGVFLRRFDHLGAAEGDDLQVNAYTYHDQDLPSVDMITGGTAIVAWHSWLHDEDHNGVAARLVLDGVPQGEELPVNTYVSNDQKAPSVAGSSTGSLLVWISNLQDGSSWGVFGQKLASDGAAVDSEFPVNIYTDDDQAGPDVAVDSEGRSVIVWWSRGQDGSMGGIYAQRYNMSMITLGLTPW